ncbi:MAG TPA: hypothetical protein V6C46_03255 [Coleofasciculaceae cyanobacterium]
MTLKHRTAALSEEEQRLAIAKNYPMFSRPMDHYDFLLTQFWIGNYY